MLTDYLENRKSVYSAALAVLGAGALVFAFWPVPDLDSRDPDRRLFVDAEYAVSAQKIQIDTDDEMDDGYVVYAGIRAPHPNDPIFEQAKKRNDELVRDQTVRLRFGKQKHDRKGRMLAYAFVGDTFINETLVREGLAYVRLTQENHRFSRRLLEAQEQARKKHRGLWKGRKRSREKTYPADPKYGNFHRPSCEECGKINRERLVEFRSANAALKEGFAPCSKCNP